MPTKIRKTNSTKLLKTAKKVSLTVIDLNHGHNTQWAILKNNRVLDHGNGYDDGELNMSVVETMAKQLKVKIKHITSVAEISPAHKKALADGNSDWSTTFDHYKNKTA